MHGEAPPRASQQGLIFGFFMLALYNYLGIGIELYSNPIECVEHLAGRI